MFWCLGPLFLLVAICMAFGAYCQFATGRWTAGCVASLVSFACFCLFLALLNGSYFWWAGRVVGASVFLAYLWYLLDTWLIHPKPFHIGGSRGETTPWNALCGLIAIGLPGLWYAWFGRFTLRRPPPSFYDEGEDEDEEDSNKSDRA